MTFLDLPQDIKNQILGPANLPDPADDADLSAVSVTSAEIDDHGGCPGRELKELKIDQWSLERGSGAASDAETRREEGGMCASSARTAWAAQVFTRGAIQMGQGHERRHDAKGGHLEEELLDALGARERLPVGLRTCAFAAEGDHLETLKWAREKFDARGTGGRARTRRRRPPRDPLKWARENDCPWARGDRARWRAKGGHLEILKWARENDCPWNEWTCVHAAYGGHLEVLKWLRENDCPWDERTCRPRWRRGHLVVLRWARERLPVAEAVRVGAGRRPRGAEVGARERLPVGRRDARTRGEGELGYAEREGRRLDSPRSATAMVKRESVSTIDKRENDDGDKSSLRGESVRRRRRRPASNSTA